ncbi:MAG: hypothetical protein IKS14_01690 [Thermoguttaceae bacterium]|nr:hypothetical protein [Thermoguttaceae bacterium]
MKDKKEKRLSGVVRLRGGFSDASGIAPRNTTIQLDDFDDDTRLKISNLLFKIFAQRFDITEYYDRKPEWFANEFCKDFLNDVFCSSNILDKNHSFDWRGMFKSINEVIILNVFNEVLDVVQYSCNWIFDHFDTGRNVAYNLFNDLFEQEYVGYRFVNGKIVAISDYIEITSIEEACNNPYVGCRNHFQKALNFLADRQKKDYKNSIKESISAVESICSIIMNGKSSTLGEALKRLEGNGIVIHNALKSAFQKLYGYASDQGGIRHAEGLFESHVDFEDAKFMLVSCSAFVNYLIAQNGKRGA